MVMGAESFRQAGHLVRYASRAGEFKYLYCNQHRTENYDEYSQNISY
jgi:hypothetical protein